MPLSASEGLSFEGNLADSGGALYVVCGSVTAKECVFKRNWAQFTAGTVYVSGGVWASQASLTFDRCMFTGNSAGQAGVLYTTGMYFPTRECLIFTNCLFRGNRADTIGGVLYGDFSRTTITNCTFADNRASTWATLGWIGTKWTPGDKPPIMMTNCILWDGERAIFRTFTGSVAKPVGDAGNAALITYSDVRGGWPGEGNLDADPRFAHPGTWVDASDPNVIVQPDHSKATWVEGDYHLKSQAGRWDPAKKDWVQDDVTSPCIDAGDLAGPFADEPQPNGGRINMGAYGGTTEASKSFLP